MTHELAHLLLLHSLEEVNNCADCRGFDSAVESETSFLAGCILIPDEAARHIVHSSIDAANGASSLHCQHYQMLHPHVVNRLDRYGSGRWDGERQRAEAPHPLPFSFVAVGAERIPDLA